MLRNPQSKVNRGVLTSTNSVRDGGKQRWLVKQEQVSKLSAVSRVFEWFSGLFSGWFSKGTNIATPRHINKIEPAWLVRKRAWNRHKNRIARKSRMYNFKAA